MSQLFASGGQSIGSSASASVLPMNIQGWFPLGLTSLSPCCPRDSQDSSPTPQFESISSSVLSFLYGPTLTSIHDHWKTIALTIQTFVGKVMSLLFNMLSRSAMGFSSKEQASFNFMTAVTIHNDFGAQENKICRCFDCFPIYLPWSDGIKCRDLSFSNIEFQANFFTLFFHPQEALWFLFTFCHSHCLSWLMSFRKLLYFMLWGPRRKWR